jgi:uncharacterized protein
MHTQVVRGLIIAMLALVVSYAVAFADPREDANTAYDRGDYATLLKLPKPLAEQGDPYAQSFLGVMYENGRGVPQDYDEAVKWYRLAAAKGDAHAQYNLGVMYENGKGVPKNYDQAIKCYRLAAGQGNADAQYNLGAMYANGVGVPTDGKEAFKWFRLAAEQGNAGAQYGLGVMYQRGLGVPKDSAEAIDMYRLAAEQGSADAQYHIGWMYEHGQGVPKDDKEAFKWFRFAAEQGNVTAQYNLGVMYATGRGAAHDNVLSYMWLSVAKINLADIPAKMTPAEVARAQKMAKRCEESNYKQCNEQQVDQDSSSAISVPMRLEGGTYIVPIVINDVITLNFIVDSSAADVSIPANVVMALMRMGTLRQSDFLGEQTYLLADGSEVPSRTFLIRSLKVGNKALKNVSGSVAPVRGSLLLGRDFLSRFKSWSVDNGTHVLLLSE